MGQALTPPWSRKKRCLLCLGLNNAGKTTLMTLLNLGKIQLTRPVHTFLYSFVEGEHLEVYGWDVDQPYIEKLWGGFFARADGVIYLIDSADQEQIPESRKKLQELRMKPALARLPWLVVYTKRDRAGAMELGRLAANLQLDEIQPLLQTLEFSVRKRDCVTKVGEWIELRVLQTQKR